MKRAILIVLDSVGIGELPDAGRYGDEGSNTLGNIARAIPGFSLPNLERLGLGAIPGGEAFSVPPVLEGAYGRNTERSVGKDTTTGHWEMAGVTLYEPFPTYPQGFPPDVIQAFEAAIGTESMANEVASGTEIINRLGEEHVRTGHPIVYTSADSVFQIAAHEDIIPIERLYDMCRIARRLLIGPHAVGRVIARPFAGKPGAFSRTDRRRDFAVDPFRPTVLDFVKAAGQDVRAVGKIEDIFNGRGMTHAVHTHGNMDGVDRTLEWMREEFGGLLFSNLVDFDMMFGHRNDVAGYANALKAFDLRLPEILAAMRPEDLLILTGDHGCDPTTPSTDHSREYTPLLVAGKAVAGGTTLGTRSSFGDIAATIADWLDVPAELEGISFLSWLGGKQA
jgi:phosphopentomutase